MDFAEYLQTLTVTEWFEKESVTDITCPLLKIQKYLQDKKNECVVFYKTLRFNVTPDDEESRIKKLNQFGNGYSLNHFTSIDVMDDFESDVDFKLVISGKPINNLKDPKDLVLINFLSRYMWTTVEFPSKPATCYLRFRCYVLSSDVKQHILLKKCKTATHLYYIGNMEPITAEDSHSADATVPESTTNTTELLPVST